MNIDAENLLLLTSRLGDPARRPLTQAQLRMLMQRLRLVDLPSALPRQQLTMLGIEEATAQRILSLLEDREQLRVYLANGEKNHCVPLTIMDAGYPSQLRKRLGDDAPPCLWLRGDTGILDLPSVAVVGSRDLNEENRVFAYEAGRNAAAQEYMIVSGNARGADITAQDACLKAHGYVTSIVSDMLIQHPLREHVLYISEEGWDEPFSTYRALHRNYAIHSFGEMTFAAQCSYGKGGTWSGCTQNLKKHWSPLYCFRDNSPAFIEFEQRGAALISTEELSDFSNLTENQMRMY